MIMSIMKSKRNKEKVSVATIYRPLYLQKYRMKGYFVRSGNNK